MNDIRVMKFTLMEKILSLSDEQILKSIDLFIKKLEQDEQEFPPLTQDEIEGVKEALEQAKNGEVYSEEEIKNKFFK